MKKDKDIVRYRGKEINVNWDRRLCIHISECVRADNDLFVEGRTRWCIPDTVTTDEVKEVIKRCPTGALTYEYKVSEGEECAMYEEPQAENIVTVSSHGPLFLRGDLDIDYAAREGEEEMKGTAFRAALCRCGASERKPFCDGSHDKVGFKEYGSVGTITEGAEGAMGVKGVAEEAPATLKVTPLEDGPLLLQGSYHIKTGSGRNAACGTECALCRCGASENKPYCDGSHKKIDFKSK